MVSPQLQVAVDIGSQRHRVAVGDVGGELFEEFDVEHTAAGLLDFFARIERWQSKFGWPVAVAMEGFNGWARPLDRQVLAHGWRLYNVNNLKLARYKEIFPGAAKSDAIDTRAMLELFRLRGQLRVARDVAARGHSHPGRERQAQAADTSPTPVGQREDTGAKPLAG